MGEEGREMRAGGSMERERDKKRGGEEEEEEEEREVREKGEITQGKKPR